MIPGILRRYRPEINNSQTPTKLSTKELINLVESQRNQEYSDFNKIPNYDALLIYLVIRGLHWKNPDDPLNQLSKKNKDIQLDKDHALRKSATERTLNHSNQLSEDSENIQPSEDHALQGETTVKNEDELYSNSQLLKAIQELLQDKESIYFNTFSEDEVYSNSQLLMATQKQLKAKKTPYLKFFNKI